MIWRVGDDVRVADGALDHFPVKIAIERALVFWLVLSIFWQVQYVGYAVASGVSRGYLGPPELAVGILVRGV